jgi:putative transposase
MKKSKFTGEQIAFALRQAEVGTPVAEVCRKMGVSEATYYRWKQLYGGLGPSELRKMRQFEEENQKLKRLVADLSLDKAMLQEVLAKKCSAWPNAGDRPLGSGPVSGERAPWLRHPSVRSQNAPLQVDP